MYLYVSSDQSDSFYHGNSPTAFRIKLPRRIDLNPSKKWTIAILDIELPQLLDSYKPRYITVNTNVCQPSFSNSSQAPILQRLYYNQLKKKGACIFDHLRYIPVTADSLDSLSIYLTDDQGGEPSFKSGHSYCTLHIETS
jgi:hypothetical protein